MQIVLLRFLFSSHNSKNGNRSEGGDRFPAQPPPPGFFIRFLHFSVRRAELRGVFLHGVEGLVADDVLDLAGVLCRGRLIHAERGEKSGKDRMRS